MHVLLPSGMRTANHVACEIQAYAREAPAYMLIQKLCTQKRFSIPTDKLALIYLSWRCVHEHKCPMTGFPALLQSAPLSLPKWGRESIVCHEMSCAIEGVSLLKNLDKLRHSSTPPPLVQGPVFQILFGRGSCAFFLWFHLASLDSFENTSENNR